MHTEGAGKAAAQTTPARTVSADIRSRHATLELFESAWAAKDLDTLVQLVTDDCVFSASVGPEPGATYRGRAEVRKGFESMLAHDAAGQPGESRIYMGEDFAVVEWSYRFQRAAGPPEVLRGCDIFEFRGTRICRKDAFRKTWHE